MGNSIQAFRAAMQSAGLNPPESIEPGRMHRFPGTGKGNGNTSGWCNLFPDLQGGVFGDWSTGLSESWRAEREKPCTKQEQEAFSLMVKESQEKARQEKEAAHREAQKKAVKRWEAAKPATAEHPYLQKKGISSIEILKRTKQDDDILLIPLKDEAGTLWSVQEIYPDKQTFHKGGTPRDKNFPKGSRKKGLYLSLGGKKDVEAGAPLCIAEGFATGAAIREATGYPVAIAIDAGNLEPVAQILKDKFPDAMIVICADDDQKEDTTKNTGIEEAEKAAEAVGGKVAYPAMGKKADFWDLWHEQGAEAVQAAITAAQTLEEKQQAADKAVIAEVLTKAESDCGAPFEEGAIAALASLKQNNNAEYMRTRKLLKKANRDILLVELDKRVCQPVNISFSPPLKINSKSASFASSSSLSSSYPSLEPSLKEKVLHFKGRLVVPSEMEKGKEKLCQQSEAARLLAEELQGFYAYSNAGVCWNHFAGTHWEEINQTDFENIANQFFYSGASIGFSNTYFKQTISLLVSSGLLPLGERTAGTIPFTNGQLDPITRILTPTTPENALDWCLPYPFDETAQCTNSLQWLNDALDGDSDTIRLLQAYTNALLTGRPDLQIFLHLVGPAGTGKSTLGRIFFGIVGSKNMITTTLKQLETNRFETAGIFRKRLVYIEEADKYGGSVSVLKAMTGQDILRLERKNQQQGEGFYYQGQVLITSNERFTTTDNTSGIERRRVTIEFNKRFTDRQREEWERRGGEKAILYPEIPGIINWALQLSREEVTGAFRNIPAMVKRANFEASLVNNPLAEWMVDNCVPDEGARTRIGDGKEIIDENGERVYQNAEEWLYPNYLLWCKRTGKKKLALNSFSSTLKAAAEMFGLSLDKKRVNEGSFIEGLRFRTDGEYSWREKIEEKMKGNSAKMKTAMQPEAPPVKNVKQMKAFSPTHTIEEEKNISHIPEQTSFAFEEII